MKKIFLLIVSLSIISAAIFAQDGKSTTGAKTGKVATTGNSKRASNLKMQRVKELPISKKQAVATDLKQAS